MAGGRGLVRRLWATGASSTETLVLAARQQDEDAVVELIRRCEKVIAAGLASAGLSPVESLYPDAQNQALLAIWQQFPQFRGDSEPCPWMYGIAKRTAASRTIDPEVRERRRREHQRSKTVPNDLVEVSADDEVAERDLLSQVMRRLSADDREILTLRVVQEMSTRETAEVLFLSESGVKARLLRARRSAAAVARQLESEI